MGFGFWILGLGFRGLGRGRPGVPGGPGGLCGRGRRGLRSLFGDLRSYTDKKRNKYICIHNPCDTQQELLAIPMAKVPPPVCVCARVCVRVCVRACVHACVRACVRAWVCVCVSLCLCRGCSCRGRSGFIG